jgi:hypothetical protein
MANYQEKLVINFKKKSVNVDVVDFTDNGLG